ncbi:hypothetical protein [Streptomyces sp. NBC_01092]|uniref:hypothetical protein n=1 Tax=Streptomyces sp. NBC_01092 TaxID=2903748 RepID=UPI00386BA8D3|nr:hypothetical protein OG254_48930 [Streptomyces sp. NBC_01092]
MVPPGTHIILGGPHEPPALRATARDGRAARLDHNARRISSATLWDLHYAQGRRKEVCNLLLANDLDPLSVLATHDVTIEDSDSGGQQIRCHIIENGAVAEEERIMPLVVPPPPS